MLREARGAFLLLPAPSRFGRRVSRRMWAKRRECGESSEHGQRAGSREE